MNPRFILFFSAVSALSAQAPVQYELRFPDAVHHEAEFKVTFSNVKTASLEVVMSRASTGRYAVHEFAKNVYNFRAIDDRGAPLAIHRPNPYQWNISGHRGTVVVSYTVFGDHADGTYAGFDLTHAHMNTPAAFAWAHGYEKSPLSVKFFPPDGSQWSVATQLAPQPDGSWSAPNLDFLMDSPIELSAHALPEWKVGNSQFRLSLHHTGTAEEASAYAQMCQAVVTEEEGIFGAFPKYDNGSYTFLVDYLPYVFGDGMEHRDSTSITGTGNLKDGAAQLIGTVAHEFFHSWNVKRIRPADLQPFDYERANMSDSLWFAEGFTQYYGPLSLHRAGLQSIDRFTRALSGTVNQVLTAPGRHIFNVIDMSRQAPFVDAAISIDATNFPNTFISYYTYGAAIALGVDLSIRAHYPGKSLDDWMRAMWKQHPDIDKPYTLEDLQTALAQATGDRRFAAQIFERHIYGKEPFPYEELLGQAGFLLRKASLGKAWIGNTNFNFTAKGAEITASTLRDSPLYAAGLDRGDVILSFDGKVLKNQQELTAWIDKLQPGATVKVEADTRAGRKQIDLHAAESPALEVVTYEEARRPLSPAISAFRSSWLGSKAVHPLPKLEKYCHVCQRKFAFDLEHCPYDGQDLHITPGSEKRPEPSRGRR